MSGPLNATVVLARCTKTKRLYGIRAEERNGDWVRTWAFPLDEQYAKREGFEANKVSGSFDAVDNYPGCPHCKVPGIFICGDDCGKISCCLEGKTKKHTCPWCGDTCKPVSVKRIDVKSGGY